MLFNPFLVGSFVKSQSLTIFGINPPATLVGHGSGSFRISEVGVGSDVKTTFVETGVESLAVVSNSFATATYLSTSTTETRTYAFHVKD